ncbi:MAG: DNA primase [Patescibacteria group bacterium]
MDQVEEIKSKTDIVGVIGEYVQLTKAGRNYKGVCPFHQERTPSFVVSPELQIYKCFGCAESGDVITFVEKFEGLEFYDALKTLAAKVGIKLTPPKGDKYSEKEKLIEANTMAAKFYNYILLNHQEGKEALDYLTNKRNINPETIKEFNLGFAPDNPDMLSRFLINKKGFNKFDLEKAGLIVFGRGRMFDRFRGRIIFPLFDHANTCVGLAGRILPSIEAKLPKDRHIGKYVNSPETLIYHKSKVLYGLNITKSEIKKQKIALVVEGEVDFLSVWQAGIKNIVAIKGTALTEQQIKILSRFADTLVLALDSDVAGDAASRRGITMAQAEGLKVKVLRPSSKYKDPDEFVQADLGEFEKQIDQAESVWDFIIDSTFTKFDGTTGEGKSFISRELIPVLASIEDKIVQSHYINLVAKRLSVPVEAVTTQISKLGNVATVKESKEDVFETPQPTVTKQTSRQQALEERFLSLSFQKSPQTLIDNIDLFSDSKTAKVVGSLKEYLAKAKEFNLKAFIGFLPSELSGWFSELVLSGTREVDEDQIQVEKEVDMIVKELKISTLKNDLENLAAQISQTEDTGKDDKMQELTKQFSNISAKLAKITEE